MIQTLIDKRLKGCTLIVIAHRLSTVMNADRIAVLEAGRVVEVGPPAELRARADSRFARLLAAQEIR